MALPKKRKKLDNAQGNINATKTRGSSERKTRSRKSAKNSSAAADSGKSEKMSKAFEIMERMESPDQVQPETLPPEKQPLQNPYAVPKVKTAERIRFRISLDRKGRGSTENRIDAGNLHEVDFGITIPSIIWKIPVLKKAAEKVLQMLSTDES